MAVNCEHLEQANLAPVPDGQHVCPECSKTGDTWVHLRKCTTCGEILCCDSSPNQHMSQHHQATKHPVAISAEPGERWAWCYVDEQFMPF